METAEQLLFDTTVNGVFIQLVKGWDAEGNEYVRLAAPAGGNLEGEEPGLYYPVPSA